MRITVTGASGYSGAWISLLEFRVFENTAGLKVMGRAENPYGTGRLPNFEMYPNPAFATVELSYRSDIDKRGVVKIVDMKGRALLNRNFELSEGLNRITLKTGHLRSGLYMLRFDTGGEHFSKKLLIN